jgi:methionine biosynthesis protein MetW
MSRLRPDLAVIARHVEPGARVLDVGCGNGELMAALRDEKHVDARGMEIDPEEVERAVSRGLSVVQGDADRDLADYPDDAFDYAILSQTLQTAERPDLMLGELLRIGRKAFVSFPNFAHWRMRASLLWNGRMPVTRHLPVSWYETQNIHHVTVTDFCQLLRDKGVRIERSWFFSGERELGPAGANWRAEYAVYLLSR